MKTSYNKRFQGRGRSSYLDVHAEKPTASEKAEGKVNAWIGFKAMKDLPRSSYAIKADPYTEANEVSTAYPILNGFNRNIGAMYTGDKNISSGNIPQYVNSYNSGFLKAVDDLALRIKLNYRYLPVEAADSTRGKRLIDKVKNSINEAISLLGATTYTDLKINEYCVYTDMPMGTDLGEGQMGHPVEVTFPDGSEKLCYTHRADVLYAMLMYYQLFLQNINGVISQLNKFRGLQGEMMRMSWERETPNLNELFSLCNKKSYLTKADSLAIVLEGEYFDRNWQTQANLISNLVSRKSESINEPLKEIISYHAMPSYFYTGMVVEDEDGNLVGDPSILVHRSDALNADNGSFIELVRTWSEHMTALYPLTWARRTSNNSITGLMSPQDMFNTDFVGPITNLTQWATYFKSTFNDLRICLDTLIRTGVVTWAKGYRPKISNDTNVPVFNNNIVNDIYASTMGGSTELVFDEKHNRWTNFTLWNQYYGIPAYDEFIGGSFLTFSTKRLNLNGASNENVAYVPQAFSVDTSLGSTGVVVALDRLGTVYQISYTEVVMAEDIRLARLVPLSSQRNHKVRVPHVVSAAPAFGNDAQRVSWVVKTLTKAFGLGYYNDTEDPEINLDPDIFAVYDYELEDITNDAIAYVKQYGPFRGSGDANSSLGFFGVR